MATLQGIIAAVTASRDGYDALEYVKGSHSTGEGDRYEERVLALVFLRCLRRGLIFQLSANNGEAGKFDDIALVWRPDGHPEARTLLVQLKHKTSPKYKSLQSDVWLREGDFSLSKYCNSYGVISNSMKMDRVTVVLLTNASLGDSSRDLFEPQDAGSVPGLEMLQAGGDLYKLNPDNHKVPKEVKENSGFVEHFHLLCNQNNSSEIVNDIRVELEALLGAGVLCSSLCDSLCKEIREWMNGESVCLNSGWSKWQALVDEYIREYVTESLAVTTNRLEYCNVAGVWDYVERHNPAWVRPPERGTEALSATKIHQALAEQTHIMVSVGQFTARQDRILRCWGPFCRWLVLVEDDAEVNHCVVSELLRQIKNERRLVIVSSRETNGFEDSCHSSDVSDDSWEDLLYVSVRLNGKEYECRLLDLVEGVNDLKALLHNQPVQLLALVRLSQPLRMGQELEELPDNYVPRKLVDQRLLTNGFFSMMLGIGKYVREWGIGWVEEIHNVNNLVVVQGKPGVGKSKMLSHLAKKVKETVPACWILRINLLEFYSVLDNRDNGVSAAEDILERTVSNKDELGRFEYALLRRSLWQSPRVVCLVDGFDEVCPDYVRKCLEMFPVLMPQRGTLFVTTRPAHVKQFTWGGSTYTLKPFSESELEDFFPRLPTSGLNKTVIDLLRLPLFAEMFVNLSPDVSETLDIVQLYEAFFRNKFRRLCEEKEGDNLSAPGKSGQVEVRQKGHEEQLMHLAALLLLRKTDIPAMPSFNRDYFVKSGIVYEFDDGKPAFLHRTFAEYFLAKWCLRGAGEQYRAAAYREAYVIAKLEFFTQCFDRMAVRGQPLLETLLDCDVGKMAELLDRGANVGETDACGRTALHLAAAYGSRRWLPVLKLLCKHAGLATLSAEDGMLGWTPMRYAAECGRWRAVHVLLNAGGELSHLGDFRLGLHDTQSLQDCFEHCGYQDLYQMVMQLNHPPKGRKRLPALLEFAVSLICAKLPRESLSLIAKEAREIGDKIVHRLLVKAINGRAEEGNGT